MTARCRTHSSVSSVQYNWGEQGFADEDSIHVGADQTDALTLQVKANDGSKDYTITLEPLNFVW